MDSMTVFMIVLVVMCICFGVYLYFRKAYGWQLSLLDKLARPFETLGDVFN
ncbi:MAG: hypothetical protein FWE56_03755 [Candidatus Bathyarchaeota archaeon]|nr:hypothetical protein [Candidatus Termiticorpusculum sp.]